MIKDCWLGLSVEGTWRYFSVVGERGGGEPPRVTPPREVTPEWKCKFTRTPDKLSAGKAESGVSGEYED